MDSDHFHSSIPHCIFMCIVGSENVLQFYGKARKSFPLNKVIYRGIIEFDNIGKMFQQFVDAINFDHKAGWLHNDIKENNVLMHKTPMQWKPVATDLERSHHDTSSMWKELKEAERQEYNRRALLDEVNRNR